MLQASLVNKKTTVYTCVSSRISNPLQIKPGGGQLNSCVIAGDPIKAPRCFPNGVPAAAYTLSETVKDRDSRLPGYAGVGNGLTILEHRFASGWDILAALGNVRFDHDAHDEGGSVGRFKLASLKDKVITLTSSEP